MPPKNKKEGSATRVDSAITGIERWIWPEWNEADVNGEKWESGGSKKPEKGKAATPSYFEDPDGNPTLPKSLAHKCTQWRRIPDIYLSKGSGGTAVFEELTPSKPVSLIQSNQHLFPNPYSRYTIGSLQSLQSFCLVTEGLEDWRPWSLIYSLNKIGGKDHKPLVNPSGKYIVKLFWVGKWRKVVIDDAIPCDEEGNPLLPMSSNLAEIWPLVIFKALLKLTSLALSPRSPEIPEYHVITALTGWMPEILTDCVDTTWKLLSRHLPSWNRLDMPQTPQVDRDSKKKDKKKQAEKDGSAYKHPILCLAQIETSEIASHPAWIVRTRDKSLREPSPAPEIPKWKLIRPQPDVLQMLEDIEKRKIPNRWCEVRSAFRLENSVEIDGENEAEEEEDQTEWNRIDELNGKQKMIIFHRNNNPNLTHYSAYLPAIKENLKAEQYKYLICDAKCDNVNIIVNFQVQNKKNEWSSLYEDQLPVIPSQDSTTDPPEIHGQTCNINYTSVHERDIEQADDSSLFIQNYSLLKYIQDPENLISINSCAQGSIRFTLPSGRTVLRFALATRYISNIDVMVEKRDSDSIQFGTLDQIVPFASKFPFSWEIYGKELLAAVKAIVDALGHQNNVKDAIYNLASILQTLDRKDMWDAFCHAFYRLASDKLGDSAIPEDLGALRLIFQDCVPSPGPQPYFPQVKTAPVSQTAQEATDDVEEITNHLQGISVKALTAASMIARNWRGAACRRNINALSGQSPGAIRRRNSAKARMDNLFSKFDDRTHEKIIKLLMKEANWPVRQILTLNRDAPHTFSLSQIEGKYPQITDNWGILFRELIDVKTKTEIFPFFTEIGIDHAVTRSRIRLIDEQGVELSPLLRKVNPIEVEPGRYIIIGEVESNEDNISGSWKLQLISSPLASNLITPRDVTFATKTETGYYIPPTTATYEPGLLFRYNISITQSEQTDLLGSFHLSCNSSTAKLKMILKKNGIPKFVMGGESTVLIPAVALTCSPSEGVSSESSSQLSTKGQRSSSRIDNKTKKSDTKVPAESDTSYVIEGYCIGDWTLSPEEELFVESLRIEEENQIRVFDNLEKSSSPALSSKGKQKSSSKANTPDGAQATWLLKIFSESDQIDNIELKMDNSRKESLRAMKLAWEAAEPGRHVKGHQARRAYIDSFEGQPIPTVQSLIEKSKKGKCSEDPDVAIQKFTARREEVAEYRRLEEAERAEEHIRIQQEYDELDQREQRIFEQINYSLQISPKPATV